MSASDSWKNHCCSSILVLHPAPDTARLKNGMLSCDVAFATFGEAATPRWSCVFASQRVRCIRTCGVCRIPRASCLEGLRLMAAVVVMQSRSKGSSSERDGGLFGAAFTEQLRVQIGPLGSLRMLNVWRGCQMPNVQWYLYGRREDPKHNTRI